MSGIHYGESFGRDDGLGAATQFLGDSIKAEADRDQ